MASSFLDLKMIIAECMFLSCTIMLAERRVGTPPRVLAKRALRSSIALKTLTPGNAGNRGWCLLLITQPPDHPDPADWRKKIADFEGVHFKI
jgi:hypothetical protein